MTYDSVPKPYSALFYGEGGKEKNFLYALTGLKKFKDHTREWEITIENASGNSPKDVVIKCEAFMTGKGYDLVLCFIDLDKLKQDYPGDKWNTEKAKLEKYCHENNIKIIWFEDNLEQEQKKVLGREWKSKGSINTLAKKKIGSFINGTLWNKILDEIRVRP